MEQYLKKRNFKTSHWLSHHKHSLWHGVVKSKDPPDVLACHKSNVKCSVWSSGSSCWNAFGDHTLSCFFFQHVSTGLDRVMEVLMKGVIDLPLSGHWPLPEPGQTEHQEWLTSWLLWLHTWVVVCLELLRAGRSGQQGKLWWGVRRVNWRDVRVVGWGHLNHW